MLTLEVHFHQFHDEIQHRCKGERVYISEIKRRVICSCFESKTGVLVRCETTDPIVEVEKKLGALGHEIARGYWSRSEEENIHESFDDLYLAGVAYVSAESKPGIWLDAYSEEPTVHQVLTRLFDEFRENGEVADVNFEDFMQLAMPNVVLLKPDEIRYHLDNKLFDPVNS